MRFDRLSHQNILLHMGLKEFQDSSWNSLSHGIRLLLIPAMNLTEVCITVVHHDGSAELDVRALQHETTFNNLHQDTQLYCETKQLSAELFARWLMGLTTMLHTTLRKLVVLDGMSVRLAIYSSDIVADLSENACCFEDPSILRELLTSVWTEVSNLPLKNSLSVCAKYLGIDLPEQTLPEIKPSINLAILGHAEEVQDFFKRLK